MTLATPTLIMPSPAGPAKPGLLTPSHAYKPFRYPWAYDFWKRQQQVHWMPEEVPLGEDCKDWATKLNDRERNLLTQIFRFFTQSDVEVNDNYMERYARVFKPTEVKMMLAAFSNMETIHIAAYALLLETIGMPESEFSRLPRIRGDAGQARLHADRSASRPNADIARTLAMFGGFTEGLQLFASFAMLMNFPRFNKMKGMGQIVSLERARREPALRGHGQALPRLQRGDRRRHQGGGRRHRRLLQDRGRPGGQVHRPGLRGRRGAGHDARRHQDLHPLHRRLAPAPAASCRRSTA